MIQVFCISYAGGLASFFKELKSYSNSDISYIPIEYAGRGTRTKEKPYSSFTSMITDVANQINNCINMNSRIALFGYSMGSLVAYEIATSQLLIKNISCLFVAAHNPPMICSLDEKYSQLNDQQLLEKMISYGGISDTLIKNKRFWPIYLSPIRHDYKLLEEYWYDGFHEIINKPLTVFYSNDDTDISIVKQWKYLTNDKTDLVEINGSHFFLKGNEDKIHECIVKKFF